MPPLRPPLKKLEHIPREPRSYEESLFEQVKTSLTPEELRAFDTFVRKRLKNKPSMDSFSYPDKETDQKKLEQKQKEALQKNTAIEKLHYIRVKIFEALLGEIMELNWFPGSFITETSDFDDWTNGVDAVLEFEAGRGAIIDFTSQKDKEKLKRKVETIFEKIERGELGRAKYFKSQLDGKQHDLKMLPMVIIGLSHQTLTELINLHTARKNKDLENHWVRHALAEELLAQIGAFQKYINNTYRRGYSPATAQKMNQAYEDLKRVVLLFQQKISQNNEVEMGDMIKERLRKKDLVYNELMEFWA